MKKQLFIAGFLTFLPLSLMAYSNTPFYATIGGGAAGMINSDWKRTRYTTGLLEVAQPSHKDTGVGTINAALGYQFPLLPIRMEAAYRWFSESKYTWDRLYIDYAYESGTGSIESEAVLFNLFLDWRNSYNSSRFVPYIGAGIGYYNNRTAFDRVTINNPGNNSISTAHKTTNGLAWSAMLGARYHLGTHWFIDVRADYTYLGKVEMYEYNPSDLEVPLMQSDMLAAVGGLINFTYQF